MIHLDTTFLVDAIRESRRGQNAGVHASLRRQGTPLATMDLLIACLALNEGAPLLTANQSHFSRIHGLRVLDYS